MSATDYEAKIASALLEAIKEDASVEADIMVQLESTEQILARVCADGASRAQKTTCMVDSLQKFADEAQEQVKQLLERETGKYERSTFFWINNSVSVRKAQGSLILAIAKLETVLEVRAEEIFQLMGKDGSGSKTKKASTMSFGFQQTDIRGLCSISTTHKRHIDGSMMSRSSPSASTKTWQPASRDATTSDNPNSNSAPSSSTSRPRSGSDSVSASTASARPFSSSNLSASIANARFKTFQVQYEILSKNPVLSAIAQEIPWKNLLDLFLLKFYAVGDVLWHQSEQPHDMAFVLCGGFLARHMELLAELSSANPSYNMNGAAQPTRDQAPLGTILAEKMVKPGGTLAALTVHTNGHMQYSVVTAKFKSIVVSLPAGKYKSILRQLTPELKQLVEQLLYDTENKLLTGLRMRLIALPKDSTGKHHHTSTSDKQTGKHKHNGYLPRKKQPGSTNSHHTLQQAASTPALSSAASLANSAAMSLDATESWASLQVAKPVEYEVNSSLLILHQASSSSSTGNLHHLAPSVALNKKLVFGGGLLHSSSVARLTAKKHTQRRLQSIKTPNPIEAFPPQPKNANDLMDQAMLAAFSSAAGGTRASHLDVVPKVHVGRLLKPLRKPAMFSDDSESESSSTSTSSRLAGRRSTAGVSTRPHTVALEQHLSQRVLVADRAEPFRDL